MMREVFLVSAAISRMMRAMSVLRQGGCVVSSIRPLATITLLACVGVEPYLKINETEPTLPAGMELPPGFGEDPADWTAPPSFGSPSSELPVAGQSEFQATEAPPWNPQRPRSLRHNP